MRLCHHFLKASAVRRAPPSSLLGNVALADRDPALAKIINREIVRQFSCLELIASENFTSRSVLQCLGSVLTNKYAEGLPGARYYGGNEFVDEVESLCRDRALAAYGLNTDEWSVNVQPYSGSVTNLAAYTAHLKPHDRLMGLDLAHGGHLTHGFYTATRKVSASSIYFESLPYRCGADGFIDYNELEELALRYRPRMIVIGGSAYPRDYDYARCREIADKAGPDTALLADMSHVSGLVAAGEVANPFPFCDYVTTTTHKSLRGPRSGMFFFKRARSARSVGEAACNDAVFPCLQGGPHEHQIAAVATQLQEVQTEEFKDYCKRVKSNAKALASVLLNHGIPLVSGGTDNHLMLCDLRPRGLTGSKVEKLLDLASITVNKNAIVGDKSAVVPGGIRLGTPALTTRGLDESDFEKVGHFVCAGVDIASRIAAASGPKLSNFSATAAVDPDVLQLGAEVKKFIRSFPFPGFEDPFYAKTLEESD